MIEAARELGFAQVGDLLELSVISIGPYLANLIDRAEFQDAGHCGACVQGKIVNLAFALLLGP
jgi:hypothetical protein